MSSAIRVAVIALFALSLPTTPSLAQAPGYVRVNFVKAGESAALRIAVPPVDHLRPFSGQEEQVLSALAAVDRLLAIGRQILATASGTSNAVMASQQLPQ